MRQELKLSIRTSAAGEQESWLELNCPAGTVAETLVTHFGNLPSPLAAVRVNDEILSLSSRLEVNARLEPVLMEGSEGAAVYRNSLAFLLAVAAKEQYPERSLYIGHSLGRGYYYTFLEGRIPKKKEIEILQEKMRQLVQKKLPITCRYMAYGEAMELFKKNRLDDTVMLLEQRSESKIMVNECDDYVDLYISPLVSNTGILQIFELMPYEDGFLLRFPAAHIGKRLEPFELGKTLL